MRLKTTHEEQLVSLKRIEGQVRGLQRMIEEGRYCVDILTQIYSSIGALLRVGDKVFRKHLEGCVTNAAKTRTDLERQRKIDEIMDLFRKFRKMG